MTWFHLSIKNGDVVSCTDDSNFGEGRCSEAMCKHFINVYTDLTLAEAREYKGPIVDDNGDHLHSHSYRVDLTKVVPVEEQHKIEDRDAKCCLITEPIDVNLIQPIEVR